MASTEVKPRKRVAKRSAPRKKAAAKKTAPAKRKPVKKAPAKKTTAKKSPPTKRKTTAPRKKTAAKKTATRKKAPAKKSTGQRGGFHRELDEHGFVVGGDSSTIAAMLLEGGADRSDINAKVAKKIGTVTRNDTERNVPALVSGVLKRLEEQGYKVESSFVVVPPARRKKRK